MQDTIQRHAKVGIVHFMAYKPTMGGEGPILETLTKLAEDPYFEVVEITTIKDENVRRQARDLLKSAHMAVAYGGQPILLRNKLNLNAEDPGARKAAVDAIIGALEEAQYLGASGVALLSGVDPGEAGRKKAVDLLVDSLSQICAAAASRSMGVVMETFDRMTGKNCKNCLVGPNALAVEVSARVRKSHPNFGLMLDLSHLPLQGETSADALGLAKDHLVHAHIGNCVMKDPAHPAYGDMHPRFGCEGGENDVPELVEFLRVLKAIGYLNPEDRKILSFEVSPMEGESAEVVIANAKRVLDAAWARV
ncbi:MAG: sugar phosphate isomerase/epimerase [Candidatus Latescibacteria bacterium]|nr:sugar phosphate isomerase/epimerase [Candidatus Latescibacterota bacterium]